MSITVDGGMGDPTYAYAELLATNAALRTRVEALTRDRDAATARAERAVELLTSARDHVDCTIYDIEHDEEDDSGARYPALRDARILISKIDALLASGGAGNKEAT